MIAVLFIWPFLLTYILLRRLIVESISNQRKVPFRRYFIATITGLGIGAMAFLVGQIIIDLSSGIDLRGLRTMFAVPIAGATLVAASTVIAVLARFFVNRRLIV